MPPSRVLQWELTVWDNDVKLWTSAGSTPDEAIAEIRAHLTARIKALHSALDALHATELELAQTHEGDASD